VADEKGPTPNAAEVRTRKDAEYRSAKWKDVHEGGIPVKKLVYAGRLRLRVVSSADQTVRSGRDVDTLTAFVKDNVTVGSTIRTDGWCGYSDLGELGYKHNALTSPRDRGGHTRSTLARSTVIS
jgi:hypothetical protein